jgi:malonyl-CoA O-methyltransferase
MKKELIKRRFTKSQHTYHQHALVQRKISNTMGSMMLDNLPYKMDRILEIGYGTGFLTEEILTRFQVNKFFLNEIIEEVPVYINQLLSEVQPSAQLEFLFGDAESILFPSQLDAILSSSTVQWLENKDNFLKKSYDSLKPEGWLFFNTFGPNNLIEIKHLTGQGLEYPTDQEWGKWMSKYFSEVKIVNETIVVNFDSPRELLRHLRYTGVTATTLDFRWSKASFLDFQEKYYERHLEKGKVSLTWDVIYVKGRKK